MHKTTGRWKLGLALALVTALCWGVLPIALKLILSGMDAYTITWYRFAAAGLALLVILAAAKQLPSLRATGKQIWWLLAIALAGLVGNYVLYLISLDYTSPAIAQVVIQLGPVFFLLGGVLIFRESFSRRQWIGFVTLLAGLALFFNRRLPQLMDFSHGSTGLGVALMVLAALSWAGYALAQKQLLRRFQSQQILLLIYVGATIVLAPTSHFGQILKLDSLQFWMLVFSCANTFVAYGAFAEALHHWEASRVSAVLAITPLLTLASVWLTNHFWPGLLEPEGLNALSILGAVMVVAGSAACVMIAPGNRGARAPESPPAT